MAVLAISAAGAWAGGMAISGGVLTAAGALTAGAQIGWMAGSLLANSLTSKNTVGPRLGDNRVQGTEYGQPFPWAAASPRLAGQIAWASPIREIANTQRVGKGGGAKHTSFTYEVDLLFKLTENPIKGVSRIWINGDMVWNGTTTQAGRWGSVVIYTGEDSQMPDPTYEAHVGSGNAPANRGCGTVVINSLQLGSSSQIPNITFEIGGAPELVWTNRAAAVGQWWSVAFGNGVFVAVGTAGANRVMTSADGINWTARPGAPNQEWKSVAFGNGIFVAVCDFGANRVMTSADGINWTLRTSTLSGWSGVAFGNGAFFAVAASGVTRLMTSADGINWTSGTIDIEPWAGVFKTPTIFIAVGNSGALSTSIDGHSWTARSTPTTSLLRSAFFGDGLYVAVGSSSTIITSPDGVTWTARSSPVSTNFWPGIYAGGIYMAFGTSGNAAQSIDGVTWVPMEVPLVDLRSAIASNDLIIVTSANSSVITSGISTFRITEPISSVVLDLLVRAGFSENNIDVSDLTDIDKPVRGFLIGQVGNTRSALDVFSASHFIEWSKTEKIRPHRRALTPVVTIPYEDLGVGETTTNDNDPMSLQVGNELEIPAQVSLSYPNTESDYQVSTEHSDRLLSSQESSQQVQMPLGMRPAEAKGVVDAILFDQVAGLTKTTLRVGLKYAYIEPGDIIQAVNFDDRVYRLRVTTKRDSLTIIELECTLDDVGALISAQITDDGYISHETPRRVAGSEWVTMDIPILRDADDEPGWYMGVAAELISDNDIWPGAVAVQAWSGDDYSALFETGTSSVLGVCTNVLPDWQAGNFFDEGSVLTVRVWGELSSSTKADMLMDQDINAMAIGRNGRWEIVRFRDVELTGTVGLQNEYTITGFLRGQRGTEWAIGTHDVSDYCVLLDTRIRRVESQTSQIGLERNVKAVTLNTLLSDVEAEVFTDTGVALKPFSVANPTFLGQDTGDMISEWQRRTRLSYRYGGLGPVVPLGELTEAYRIRVYDGPTLVRTVNVTDPKWTYEAADIASDGFTTGDPVRLEIAQLSAIVGEGYITEVTGIAP